MRKWAYYREKARIIWKKAVNTKGLEVYAVQWLKDGKVKQREFENLFEARAFSVKLKSNMNFDQRIVRCYLESPWQTLRDWSITFKQIPDLKIPVYAVLAVVLVLWAIIGAIYVRL